MAKGPEPHGKLHEITFVKPFLSIGICGRLCCFTDGGAGAVRRFSLDSGREEKSIAADLARAVGAVCFAFDQRGATRLAGPDGKVYATLEGSDDDSCDRLRVDAFDDRGIPAPARSSRSSRAFSAAAAGH